MLGHIVEFYVLTRYVPAIYALIVLIQSGIFSIIAVIRSENIFGVWCGHVMLNVLLVIVLNM
jgi:hypothetical protein